VLLIKRLDLQADIKVACKVDFKDFTVIVESANDFTRFRSLYRLILYRLRIFIGSYNLAIISLNAASAKFISSAFMP
jgi:hypothetical protein